MSGVLAGRVVAVTGAAGAIGAVTARLLAERGARVVGVDLPGTDLGSVMASLGAVGGEALAIEADISDEGSVVRCIERIRATRGRLDGLVNNAAATRLLPEDGDLVSLDLAIWDGTYAVNVRGTAIVCKHAIPLMCETGGGAIVNLSSGLAVAGDSSHVAYGTSKAAIEALTRYVATQYGRRGIRCNAVAPGLVRSDAVIRTEPPEVLDAMRDNTLLSRLGEPLDTARAVAFLLSDDASFVTGQVLRVDGGHTSHQTHWDRLESHDRASGAEPRPPRP